MIECNICNEVVRNINFPFHLFKEHNLSFGEAVTIPGFNVNSITITHDSGSKSEEVSSDQYTAQILRCDFCGVLSKGKGMLMHLYSAHGLSYKEAVEKLSHLVCYKNKRKCSSNISGLGAPKKDACTYVQ